MQTTFTPQDFRETFKPVLMKWTCTYAIFVGAVILFIFSLHHMLPYAISALGVDILRIIEYGRKNVVGGIVICVNGLGIFAIGCNVCGVVAIGINAGGIIAIGGNAFGIISIGTSTMGIYTLGGHAIGVYAIGWRAHGNYVFSYSAKGSGRYLFSPYRQDPKAVAFFMR